MVLLPQSSLYMIHQTCGILRHLLGGFEFKSFRLEMLRSNEEAYCITKAGFDELYIVKRLFRRRSLCNTCGELFDSGELEDKLRALWKPVLCTVCNEHHPELLFSQGQRREDRCVGLLGHFAVCKHLKVSGKSLEFVYWPRRLEREKQVITCEHPDHISAYDKYNGSLSCHVFQPRIKYSSAGIGTRSEYVRSFPMMKVHRRPDLDVKKLRSALLKQLQELDGDGLCQHASGQLKSIASFMILGKPRCSSSGWNWCYDYQCPDCTYACNQCGARYSWFWEKDYVILHVQMTKNLFHPDSIHWLSNISFENDEHPILNHNTENVLWCSDPGCGTGCGERWLLMLEIFKRHTVHFLIYDDELSSRCTTSTDRLPFTLEYQTFHDVADWPAGIRRDDYWG